MASRNDTLRSVRDLTPGCVRASLQAEGFALTAEVADPRGIRVAQQPLSPSKPMRSAQQMPHALNEGRDLVRGKAHAA